MILSYLFDPATERNREQNQQIEERILEEKIPLSQVAEVIGRGIREHPLNQKLLASLAAKKEEKLKPLSFRHGISHDVLSMIEGYWLQEDIRIPLPKIPDQGDADQPPPHP
jgi:hypothetical protein